MQQLRLIGLILFITTVFLSLAAFATQTTEIRLFDARQNAQPTEEPIDETQPPPDPSPKFVSIPILWPLALSGGLGLVLWFGTAPRDTDATRNRRRRRRTRR